MSQAQLGAALGHQDGSVISKYERGEVVPHASTVSKIEEALGIDDGRLMTARYEQLAAERGDSASPGRRSLSYGGAPLSPDQEDEVLEYIEWIRQRDRREG